MKTEVKRVFAFILAALMLVSALFLMSCDNSGEGEESGSEQAGSEQTAAPEFVGEFTVADGVKIIYPDRCDDSVKAAAKLIAQAILDQYGINVRVGSDWSAAQGPEILLGYCTGRENSVEFNRGIYTNGYGYLVLSDKEIAISARKSENVTAAAELFIEEVIKKNSEPIFAAGTTMLCNNERAVEEYILNGVALSEYSIVADDSRKVIAQTLHDAINEKLCEDLPMVSAKSFSGGHAIKIGSFKCESYDGDRYAVSSEVVDGISTIYVDGDTRVLLEAGVEFLLEKYLTKSPDVAKITVPENTYVHVGGTKLYEVSSEQSVLGEGVTYYRKHYNNFEDKNVDAFITVVSGDSPAKFGVWVADFDSHSGKAVLDVKTVGTLANELEKTGVNVLAATNAGYFHMAAGTNYPWGMQIVDGKVVWEPSYEDNEHSCYWLGMTFDGEFVGGNVEDYENTYKGKIKYGVGCGGALMTDGVLTKMADPTATSVVCLTAVAFTKDGGFVLICVDGRPHLRDGKSEGASFFDMISIFRDLDLEYTDAYVLDGGGSTEMVIERNPGSSTFKTVNDPSDGKSRKVSDIIAVYIP